MAHPELVDQAESRALALLAVADADEVAESIEWALREADADQLAFRAGRVYGRGYVHENEAASEILVANEVSAAALMTMAPAGNSAMDSALKK